MNCFVFGASGFIGSHLCEALSKSHTVTCVTRRQKNIKSELCDVLTWDDIEKSPQVLSKADVIINLCGQSLLGLWTTSYKKSLFDSRTQPLEKIANYLDRIGHTPHIICASGVGVHGYQVGIDTKTLPPVLDEASDITNKYLLSDIGQQLEQTLPLTLQQHTCYLRFGVVLSKNGGSLPLMLFPHYFGLGAVIGNGYQPFSWVALNDAISSIMFAVEKKLAGPYNVCSPNVLTHYQFTRALAHAVNRPQFLRIPQFLTPLLGEMVNTTILKGQNISSKKLQALGFEFQYEEVESLF